MRRSVPFTGFDSCSDTIPVCYLAHYTGGGSAISLRTLLEHLDRERYVPAVIFHRGKNPSLVAVLEALDIPVVCLVPPSSADTPSWRGVNLTARLGKRGVRGRVLGVYRAIGAVGHALRRDARWIPPMTRHLRELRPHIVHCNNGLRSHRLDLLLCAVLGIPVVCHVRNFETLTLLERLIASTVWRFIYISNAVAAHCHQQGIPPWQGVVIHNAVSKETFAQPDPLPRAEFGWGPEHFVVANVGRLVRWKGQDVFLQALAQLAPRMPHLRVLVVGGADDNPKSQAFADELHHLVHTLDIADRVTFTGRRPDVARLMAAADVVVHSAVTPEPFGRVVIEAMAAGRPVIASAAGGVLDVVEPEVVGLLVPPGDADALAAALGRLAANPTFAAQLAEAGQRHVAAHFSAAHHVAQVTALYRSCLLGEDLEAEPDRPL
jgi:glycosyltransferase involved in cell wall biosynthesis